MSIAEKFETIVDAVYEKGKKDELDAFWDAYQNNGVRVDYQRAFADTMFTEINPKYVVKPTSPLRIEGMFYKSRIKTINKEKFDFSKIEGVSQDSYSTAYRQTFDMCTLLEKFPDLGLPAGFYYYFFRGCSSLHTIEVLRFVENTKEEASFTSCTKLANITIEGIIGRSISFKDSPLSVKSMKSIITHLNKYDAKSYTLTVQSKPFEMLEAAGFTDDDKALLSENGITVTDESTWATVVDDLNWNLVLA